MQAAQYRRQANEEQLYVMLLRLVSLVVETIPQHKAFDRSDGTYQALRKVGGVCWIYFREVLGAANELSGSSGIGLNAYHAYRPS